MLYAYPLSSYHIIFSKANPIRAIIHSFVRKSIPLFSKSNLIKLHLTDPEIMSHLHWCFRVPNHTVPKSVIPLEKITSKPICCHVNRRQSHSGQQLIKRGAHAPTPSPHGDSLVTDPSDGFIHRWPSYAIQGVTERRSTWFLETHISHD